MQDRDLDLVCSWIDAYHSHHDEVLLTLAHPEVEIRPRVGQGEKLYRGVEGVRRWLDATRASRPAMGAFSVGTMGGGRVLAEAALEGVHVSALFEIRDDKIAHVEVYLSDPEMLEQLGKIKTAPAATSTYVVGGAHGPMRLRTGTSSDPSGARVSGR
jgi:hypothetical protein